jgi:hypothetical protein
MQIGAILMSSFARFYEATGPQKVAIVRDARLNQSDPDSYTSRDYYFDLRNTLRQTHWATGDITTFAQVLDALCARQKQDGKEKHLREIGESYIRFWIKRGAGTFDVPRAQILLGGLPIRVSAEVGMVDRDDKFAMKLWFNAPRPTRAYRQAAEFMLRQAAADPAWSTSWRTVILDVRREEVLPAVPIPRDLRRALEGQAGAFKQIWEGLDEPSAGMRS